MNRVQPVIAVLSAALVAGCGSAATAGRARPDSGIRGRVLIGPTCPVQRVGQSCERPYATLLYIRGEPGGRLVAKVRSARDGRFSVALPAGRYLLVPKVGPNYYPQATARNVIVASRRYTRVTISYDTGIR